MTRFSAVTAILIGLIFSISSPARSQSNSATDYGCFPWQEYRNGECVAKSGNGRPPPLPSDTQPAVAPPPPPLPPAPPPPPPVVAAPCPDGGARNASGQCPCPAGTHLDAASARCVADIAARKPENFVCDGGTASNGSCLCPSGYNLMPTGGNASGGICVRTNAENCQGGQQTVSGRCMCNGQVTMSGETYLLEFTNGKCLPMHCPVTALLRDGKCGTTSSSAEPVVEPEHKPESKPENTSKPAPKEARQRRDDSDEDEHRHHCRHGMVMTRVGCVPAHRDRDRDLNDLYRQYRNYRY
jgi:hypothetical protein